MVPNEVVVATQDEQNIFFKHNISEAEVSI
jgi:hypothetical protein